MDKRGEESKSELTDWQTIREQSYLYTHAEKRKKERKREEKERDK
jgi:hypothetical protein